MPFLGRFEHTVDAKGRLSIPAPYREELALARSDRLILAPYTGDGGPVLWAFPPPVWEQAVKARLAEHSPFDKAVIQFKREVVQKSWSCVLDSNGRILMPSELRAFAGLEREVVLAAMDDWFEIWSADAYRKINGDADASLAIDPSAWEKLS